MQWDDTVPEFSVPVNEIVNLIVSDSRTVYQSQSHNPKLPQKHQAKKTHTNPQKYCVWLHYVFHSSETHYSYNYKFLKKKNTNTSQKKQESKSETKDQMAEKSNRSPKGSKTKKKTNSFNQHLRPSQELIIVLETNVNEEDDTIWWREEG